jgi:arylsulfatase A-like enzyme
MQRPNILILSTDQQRWDALGTNGNRDIQTPNLDALAASGVNFDHHFVQNPVCMPSRVSFLTGQYPSTLGITHMGVPVPPETVTLPRLLHPYGYVSANIGKLHFLPHANRDHRVPHPDYGFDQLEIADEPGPYEDAYRAWVRRTAPDQLDAISAGLPPAAATWYRTLGVRDTVAHPPERFPKRAMPFQGCDEVTHSAFVAEQTMTFIQQQGARPWLCIAGFYSPHSPWVVPQRFLDQYDPDALSIPAFPPELEAQRAISGPSDDELRAARHGYYAMISEVDDHIGRILACLDDQGQAENTIVVFISDHGDWLGARLRYGKGYPGDDSVSRVPLIVRWSAGVARPGRTVSDLVEALDVVPTLLDGTGIQLPPHLQGRSLLPVLQDRPSAARPSVLMEHTGWRNLRTADYRYIVERGGQETLYDLTRDPQEYDNRAGDPAYAPALAHLRGLLLQHLLDAERPRPRVWPY